MAYVDAGPSDGQVALLQHGEPSWSFLYRHVVWVLTENGIRCVAPDMVGFGRSDKPLHQADYSYAQLVEWTRERVFDHLDLREVTLVGQDWGGLIGLRLLAEHPDRFNRVVAANTGLPTGDFDMPEVCAKAGVRAMPGLVPTRPDDPASEANRAAWEGARGQRAAVPARVQRQRSDHRRDGTDPTKAPPRHSGPQPTDHPQRRPLPSRGRRR